MSFIKTVAVVISMSLLGNSLAWAAPTDSHKKVPLTAAQQQALQDYAVLEQIIDSYTLSQTVRSSLFILTALFVGLLALNAMKKDDAIFTQTSETLTKDIKQTVQQTAPKVEEKLSPVTPKSTSWLSPSDQLKISDKKQELKELLQSVRQEIGPDRHAWRSVGLSRNLKNLEAQIEGARDLQALKQVEEDILGWKYTAQETNMYRYVRLVAKEQRNPALAATYQQEIQALLKRMEAGKNLLLTQETDFAIRTAVSRYAKLFDFTLPEQEQLTLLQSLKKQPWFLRFSPKDQKEVYKVIESVVSHSPLRPSRPLAAFLRTSTADTASKYVVALLQQVFTKRNVALSALVVAGLVTATTTQADTDSYKKAARIEQNVKLFLEATPQELAELENDPVTYKACINQAALLNFLRNADPKDLKEIEKQIRNNYFHRLTVPIRAS